MSWLQGNNKQITRNIQENADFLFKILKYEYLTEILFWRLVVQLNLDL